MMKILLASNSPRRKELLLSLNIEFESVKVDCDEIYPKDLAIEKVAEYLSELKSNAYKKLSENEILITADTIVAIGNEILGKPKDENEAKEMLRKLSGNTHQVLTGITLRSTKKNISVTDIAQVETDILTEKEISDYINRYKPFDKAGSYGVQEWFGMAKIKRITGSYYTVMGLPTHLLYGILKDFELAFSKDKI